MSFALKLYQRFLNRYPFTCQALQTGILMGAGDAISQTIVEDKPLSEYNYTRTAQFFCVGAIFIGPALTAWYRILAKQFGGSGGKKTTLQKVAVDQLVFSPICIALFISCISTVQGHSIEKTKEELERNYFDILKTNYKIWPFVQLGNFYFVPLQYQVLLTQSVALFWNAYLAYKTRPEDNP